MGELEKYYRHTWMSDKQWECVQFLGDLFYGFHHMDVDRVKEWGNGIAYNTSHGRLATFDFSDLTRLVLMAHKRCIRAEIAPSGPGLIKIILHKRKGTEGRTNERHPDLKELIAMCEQMQKDEIKQKIKEAM